MYHVSFDTFGRSLTLLCRPEHVLAGPRSSHSHGLAAGGGHLRGCLAAWLLLGGPGYILDSSGPGYTLDSSCLSFFLQTALVVSSVRDMVAMLFRFSSR